MAGPGYRESRLGQGWGNALSLCMSQAVSGAVCAAEEGERLPPHAAPQGPPGEGRTGLGGRKAQETFLLLRTSSADLEKEVPGQWLCLMRVSE